MKIRLASSSSFLFSFSAASIFSAGLLRALIIYRNSDDIRLVLGVLGLWLVVLVSEPAISRKWTSRYLGGYFTIYLIIQTALVCVLLVSLSRSDFASIFLGILSMQMMQRFSPRTGWIWIGSFTIIMSLLMVRDYGALQAIALALLYSALNSIMALFSMGNRHSQEVRHKNQSMAQELETSNRQLQAYSQQLEQLAVARERLHMARELHDSVTQTIFSMNLTTQSALVLLERDPSRVGGQLEHLNQLAQSALSEMHVLISELRPEQVTEGGLTAALRRHLASRHLPETLTVSIEAEGDQTLHPAEEQGLFRIVQEAVNNVVKHSHATQASIRLHQTEPFWIEVQDNGQGFDSQSLHTGNGSGGRVGLSSMRERAEQIGWNLRVITSPGAGTSIRVEKPTKEDNHERSS